MKRTIGFGGLGMALVVSAGCVTLNHEHGGAAEKRGLVTLRSAEATPLLTGPALIMHADVTGDGAMVLFAVDGAHPSGCAARPPVDAGQIRGGDSGRNLVVPAGKTACAVLARGGRVDVAWHARRIRTAAPALRELVARGP